MSADPLAAQFADLSPFNYAGNKPINKVDIDGLQEQGRSGTPKGESNHNNSAGAEGGNEVVTENEVLGISPMIITYKESQRIAAAAPDRSTSTNEKADNESSPEENPVESQESSNIQYLDISDIIKEGKSTSETFSSLLEKNEINSDNFYDKIYLSREQRTVTHPSSGIIEIEPGSDMKTQIIKLTHELTNRLNAAELVQNANQAIKGDITPEQYAERAVQIEFEGQLNQLKVASEIGYEFSGADYQSLNKLVKNYSKDKSIDLRQELTPNPSLFNKYVERGKKMQSK